MIKYILAVDKNNLVGKSNSKFGLAWHYPEDLKFYREQTIKQITVMGHNTYKQIGHALPDRTTIVMSNNKELKLKDAVVVSSLKELFSMYNPQERDLIICGGVQIFNLFKEEVNEILLTRIEKEYQGDIYFTELDELLSGFKLESEKQGETKELCFQKWIRN